MQVRKTHISNQHDVSNQHDLALVNRNLQLVNPNPKLVSLHTFCDSQDILKQSRLSAIAGFVVRMRRYFSCTGEDVRGLAVPGNSHESYGTLQGSYKASTYLLANP